MANNDLQSTTQKSKDRAPRIPLTMAWDRVLRNGKLFLLN